MRWLPLHALRASKHPMRDCAPCHTPWRRGVALASAIVLGPVTGALAAPGDQGGDLQAQQWAQYQAQAPKSILELQPFRSTVRVELEPHAGTATLVDLNPAVNVWFVLTLEVPGSDLDRSFHLENPLPREQRPRLAAAPGVLRIEGLKAGAPCEIWRADSRTPPPGSPAAASIEEAARSGLPYAPLCGGRLYLRNPVKGHRTSLERITGFLRDHVYGGEKVITFVKERMYRDAFLEPGSERTVGPCPPPDPRSSDLPLAAATRAESARQCLMPGSLGLDVLGMEPGFAAGRWYPVRDLEDVHVSVLTPGDLASAYLGEERHVNRLDATEAGALVYLVAFDLGEIEVRYALGTDHPRLDWSPRPPEPMRDARLPGPDGVGAPAPLVMNGLVSPSDVERTVATFAGGFKREHGAFRYGSLALVNQGSHYGFIQEGVILSKLQPGLATLLSRNDGSIEMKTWTASDNASLESVRYARQNGVPLIEPDPSGAGVPGTLVNLWGAGNWSGSVDEALRTVRAGVCLQQTATRRFLIFGYFSAATPSAMARVFQAYRCRYAMQLDINALEHTYLALYVHRDGTQVVEHLVQGMNQCDSHTHSGLAPRFLAAPDDRDFFYLIRREHR